MKKINLKYRRIIPNIALLVVFIFTQSSQAQITVGLGEEPATGSILQLKEKPQVLDDSYNAYKGLGLPRVALSSKNELYPMFLKNPDQPYNSSTNPETSEYASAKATLKKSHKGLAVYNVNTVGTFTEGLYIWTGDEWAHPGGATSPWRVSPTDDSENPANHQVATRYDEDIYRTGHVAIGSHTKKIDPSAILNVTASKNGVLFPRIALKSPTDKASIEGNNPPPGLLVYNTGTESSFPTTGYMFWDGSSWRLLASASSESARAILNCAGAGMSPAQQVVGGTAIITGTVLQIPYSGGNGGSFNGVTLTSVGNTNVKATIASGMLSVGNGVLNFSLSGNPTLSQQAPNGITFDLTPFLNANPKISGCNSVTVGDVLTAAIEETATMGYLMRTADQYYALTCNSPDGKFSIRVEVPATVTSVAHGNQNLNVQVRNNQSFAIPVIWNFNTDYGGSLSTAGVLTMPSGRWGGDRNSGGNWTDATGDNVYWGQVGIYDANNRGPEYRRYTWIPQGANNKVCYEATIMTALDTTTPTTAVHPTRIKAYIKFSQVTAQ